MPDDAIRATVSKNLSNFMEAPERRETEKLVLAAKILAAEGHSSGLAGQITLRAEGEGYWTLPLGMGFEEAEEGQLLRVDEDVQTLEGEGIANPAVRFHIWVYRARPDLRSIVHTHPPAASALSMINRPLKVSHMDAMMLYDDCAWLPEWPGVPIADEEGRIISEALGDKKSILLAHHGLLTGGDTVEEAVYLAYFLERAARLQLDAEAAGEIRDISAEHGREAREFLRNPKIMEASFSYWARQIDG